MDCHGLVIICAVRSRLMNHRHYMYSNPSSPMSTLNLSWFGIVVHCILAIRKLTFAHYPWYRSNLDARPMNVVQSTDEKRNWFLHPIFVFSLARSRVVHLNLVSPTCTSMNHIVPNEAFDRRDQVVQKTPLVQHDFFYLNSCIIFQAISSEPTTTTNISSTLMHTFSIALLLLGAAASVSAECCKVPIKCTNGLLTTYVWKTHHLYPWLDDWPSLIVAVLRLLTVYGLLWQRKWVLLVSFKFYSHMEVECNILGCNCNEGCRKGDTSLWCYDPASGCKMR